MPHLEAPRETLLAFRSFWTVTKFYILIKKKMKEKQTQNKYNRMSFYLNGWALSQAHQKESQ